MTEMLGCARPSPPPPICWVKARLQALILSWQERPVTDRYILEWPRSCRSYPRRQPTPNISVKLAEASQDNPLHPPPPPPLPHSIKPSTNDNDCCAEWSSTYPAASRFLSIFVPLNTEIRRIPLISIGSQLRPWRVVSRHVSERAFILPFSKMKSKSFGMRRGVMWG